MMIWEHFELFWIVLEYASFCPIALFEYGIRNCNARLVQHVLRTNPNRMFELSPSTLAQAITQQMFELVRSLLTHKNVSVAYFFKGVFLGNKPDVVLAKESIVEKQKTHDISWFCDLQPANEELTLFFKIATGHFDRISQLCENIVLTRMFFADAPLKYVTAMLCQETETLLFDTWHAILGIIHRQNDDEIISLLELLERDSRFEIVNMKTKIIILRVVLSDCGFLSHHKLVQWLTTRRMTPAGDEFPRIAAFGDEILFTQASALLATNEELDTEKILFNAIRSRNWDFVRILAKKYGYEAMTKALWYVVACEHTSLLQICFDESLADVKSCLLEERFSNSHTYQFLRALCSVETPSVEEATSHRSNKRKACDFENL
jgi:hypothetical protein